MKLSNRATVKVFNRYGIEVFSQRGDYFKTNNWERGGLPAGTYYYIIERNDGINKEPNPWRFNDYEIIKTIIITQ